MEAQNGWVRVTVGNITDGTSMYIRNNMRDSPTGESYQGDDVSGMYMWGAQLEQGTYPTSYIKTESAAVVRAIDDMNLTGLQANGILGATEGTIFVDIEIPFGVSNTAIADFIDAGVALQFNLISRSDGSMVVYDHKNGSYAYGSSAPVKTGIVKTAISYTPTNLTVCQNGVIVGNSYTPATPFDPVGGYQLPVSVAPLTQLLKGMQMYPTKLTDQEIMKLTT